MEQRKEDGRLHSDATERTQDYRFRQIYSRTSASSGVTVTLFGRETLVRDCPTLDGRVSRDEVLRSSVARHGLWLTPFSAIAHRFVSRRRVASWHQAAPEVSE
jgi:hypothetical protein